MNRIKRDDTVVVTTGKDRGKRGKVHRVLPKEDKVLVAGVNVIKRHTKPRAGARQAGVIERESPIHLSNVMLLCAKCNRPTRVGYRTRADGTKVRYCKHCNEDIS
jgi:large subunit ribosomal protein L24